MCPLEQESTPSSERGNHNAADAATQPECAGQMKESNGAKVVKAEPLLFSVCSTPSHDCPDPHQVFPTSSSAQSLQVQINNSCCHIHRVIDGHWKLSREVHTGGGTASGTLHV